MDFEKFIGQRLRFMGRFIEQEEIAPYRFGLREYRKDRQRKDYRLLFRDIRLFQTGEVFRDHVYIRLPKKSKQFDQMAAHTWCSFTAELYHYTRKPSCKSHYTAREYGLGLREIRKVVKISPPQVELDQREEQIPD